ncbi:leucine carboxyl methyltransferase 1 homolog, partial [Haematococcus lacustris]
MSIGKEGAQGPGCSLQPHSLAEAKWLRLPTYILSECVLVYMDPGHSSTLLAWLAAHFACATVVIYEQVEQGYGMLGLAAGVWREIKPHDAFGRQMCANLQSRGCPLRGITTTPDLEAHC